jgi:hypothetical protein
VLLASGAAVAISKIRAGMRVKATDPYQHVTAVRSVVKVIRHHRWHAMAAIVLVTGAVIQATSQHPIWDATTHQFTYAADLHTGDRLLEPSGATVAVRAVRHYQADLTAYNLDVTGIHTYYVEAGQVDVLVHNSCGTNERIISSEASVAHNSAAISEQPEGNGFSGVYDPATARFEARLSSEPNNLVNQFGGHGVINREVFGGSNSTVAFTAIVRGAGLEVRWNSASVNLVNWGARAAPAEFREGILSGLSNATGLSVSG